MEFDPRDPQHAVDGVPFATLSQIRAEEPICRTPTQGWFLSRRDEIMTCLHEVTTFVADLAPLSGLTSHEDIPADELFLSEVEEPRHGQIRRLYNSCFARHRLNDLGSFIENSCNHLLDRLFAREDGIADLHVGYAMPIPSLALAQLMGLPAEAAAKFMEFALDGTLMQRGVTPGVAAGGPPIQQYFAEHLARRRRDGNTGARDVYQALIDAEIEGAPLSDQEIVTQLQFMVMAGVHTTRTLLTHLVHRLLFDPGLYQTLRADPSLVPNYVEESLRHDSPVQATSRRCTRDFELGDVKIAQGDWLEVGLGSANRDERAYEDPEVFRLDRDDPRDHLAFGAGSHICPGSALARIEAQTCVRVLLERTAALHPVDGVQYPPLPSSLSDLPIPARLTAAG